MATTRKSTLQQTLDVDLNSLKADVNVKAFSCDVTGRYAVLGDSGGLLLVDLEYPYQRPRIFHHQSKAGVDCLRWNPHVSHQDHVASTSKASVLVWRVDNDYRPLMAGLRKHTGPVNDLAWAPDLPQILATAGEDGAIHLWDVRSHQSPCQSFSAGPNRPAHLLAWNKLSPNALASAHDHEVWLWDTRKGHSSSSSSSSSYYFATTTSSSNNNNRTSDADCSIQSLGWNPTRQTELVVSGKDGGVTFWEIDNLAAWSSTESNSSTSSLGSLDVRETVELYLPEEQPKLVHWTPFGNSGMVSVGKMKGSVSSAASSSSLSSLSSPRLDTLYLWSFHRETPPPLPIPPLSSSSSTKPRATDSLQLVQRFEGHKAPILAVEWRVVDGLVFQLVSLDAAGHLRLWRMEPWMLRACGHATGTTARAEAAAAAAAAAMTVGGGSKEMGASSSSLVNKNQPSNRSLSHSMAAKLTLGALKTEVMRPVSHHQQQHTPAVPPRPSPFSSTHAAASVWQEMIEVEDMARRGELTEVDIEMIDSMARTMRLSLGPVQIRPPEAVAVGVVGGGGGGGAKFGSGISSAAAAADFPRPSRSRLPGLGQGGEEDPVVAALKTPGRGASSTSVASTSSSPRHEEESEGEGGGDEEEEGDSMRLLVTVRFPPAYPFGAMPQFQFRAVRDVEDEDEEDEDEEGNKDEDEEEEQDLQCDYSSSSGNRRKRSSSSRKNATPKKKNDDAEEEEQQGDKSGEGEDDDGDNLDEDEEDLFLEGERDPPSKASKTRRRNSSQGQHRRNSSTSSAAGSGLLSQVGRDMLRREVEDVARLALEAQRPCLELCIRHLQKTLIEAAEAGLLLTATGVVAGDGGDGSLTMRTTATGADGLQVPASPSSMPEGSKALMSKVQRDQLLPCPRYSGAVFTGQGILLCLSCHVATRLQTTGQPPPPLKKRECGSKKNAAASPAAAAAATKQQQRPPRTYAALLQRHRTAAGIIRKGFLSAAETPPSRAGGPGRGGISVRGGGGGEVGRALFPGGDLMSPAERGSSLFMELREEDEDEDDEEEEEEREKEEARINDDDDEDEDGDWSSGDEEDEDKVKQMSASASALYASYFQSPQSRLPINHPDHEYSFHFQEDDPSMEGLGLSVGGRPGMVSLVGGGTAPAACTTLVSLVDFSHALPGSSILAAALRLGPSEDDKAAAFGSGTVVICFEPTSPPPLRHGSEKESQALHRSPLSSKQGGGNTGKRRGTSELQLSLLGRGISAGNNSNYSNTPASPRLLQHPGTRSPSSHLRRQAALAQGHGHAEQHHVSFANTGRSPSKIMTSSHGLRRLASEAELRSVLKPSLVRGQSTGTGSGSGDHHGGASSSLSAGKVALRRHNSLSQQERSSSSSIAGSSASSTSSSSFSSSPAAAVIAPRSHLHRLHYHTIGNPSSSSSHHQGFGRDATAPLSRVRKLAGAMKREGSFLSALYLLSDGGGGGDSAGAAGEQGPRSPSAAMVGSPSLPSRSASAGSGGEGEHHHYYLGTSPATSSSLLGTSPAGRPFLVPSLRPSITIGANTFLDASGHSGGSGGSGGGGAALMMSSASSASTGGAHAHHHYYRQQASFSPSSPWGPLARQITEAREISELCRINAEVMDRYGGANRAELVKLWSMLFLSTSACLDALCVEATRLFKGNNSNTSNGVGGVGGGQPQQQQQQSPQHQVTVVASSERLRPWAEGPLGRPLVEKLLDLYEKEGDVQTLATIVCVLDVKHPYTLLRASKRKDYDRYLLAYAELLYRWGALETRTEVLKRLSSSSLSSSTTAKGTKAGGAENQKGKANEMMVIAIRCQACGAAGYGVERGNGICRQCKAFAFRCVVCELTVKGHSMFCLNCSHGGHTPHMYQWFRENDVCPSGCGCRCVFSQCCDISDSEGQHVQQRRSQQQQNDGGKGGGGGGGMWG